MDQVAFRFEPSVDQENMVEEEDNLLTIPVLVSIGRIRTITIYYDVYVRGIGMRTKMEHIGFTGVFRDDMRSFYWV